MPASATSGVRVHASVVLKSADLADKFLAEAKKAMDATRKEPGCIAYELFRVCDRSS